jgi:integrase
VLAIDLDDRLRLIRSDLDFRLYLGLLALVVDQNGSRVRHTFCSHLAMRGAAPVAIQMLAGHESSETTKRYLHLAPVTLRETVKLLDLATEEPDEDGHHLGTGICGDRKPEGSSAAF